MPAARHVYRCPLRWADMDQLGHVNNVTYVDYLQEARVDMLREHAAFPGGEQLAEGVVVVRHRVQYVAPLVFRPEPVSIDCWVTDVRAATFTLAFEVYDDTPAGRRVYLRARTVHAAYRFDVERSRRLTDGERTVLEWFLEPDPDPLGTTVEVGQPTAAGRHTYACPVRFSDVDAYRHVNNVKHVEYYQEARILHLTELGRRAGVADVLSVVVAQVDLDYRAPVVFRERPYRVDTWVAVVGRSSFVIDGEIVDDDAPGRPAVLSRSRVVLVAFDPATQRPRPIEERQRAVLTGNRG